MALEWPTQKELDTSMITLIPPQLCFSFLLNSLQGPGLANSFLLGLM